MKTTLNLTRRSRYAILLATAMLSITSLGYSSWWGGPPASGLSANVSVNLTSPIVSVVTTGTLVLP